MPLLSARPLSLAALFSIACAGGCQDQAGRLTGAPRPPPDISGYVTGAAAASLGPDGLFAETEPPRREGPMISRDQAAALAVAYVRTYAQFLKASWEQERGASIHVAALTPESRVYFADTPYGRFPDGPFHPAFRRAYGPYYLVTLAQGDVPALVVAVSAYNAEVSIDERGHVREPALGGAEFMSSALGMTERKYDILTPERAVERVARASGGRATAPPDLLLRGRRYHPAFPLWRVPLDRGVRVRGRSSGATRIVDELYVDGTGFLVPAAAQPQEEVQNLVIGPPWEPELRQTVEAHIPIRSGKAIRYEEVTVEPAS